MLPLLLAGLLVPATAPASRADDANARLHVLMMRMQPRRLIPSKRAKHDNHVQKVEANQSSKVVQERSGIRVSTETLSKKALQERGVFFESIIAAFALTLVLAGFCVWRKHQARKDARTSASKGARTSELAGSSREGGGAGYAPLLEGDGGGSVGTQGEGLGMLSEEEMAEALGEEGQHLSKEERNAKIQEWAQINAEKLRERNAAYLTKRKYILLGLMALYVVASVGLPYAHRQETSCSQGYFWETHMQFLATFVVTKFVELWLFAEDETLESDVRLTEMLLRFVPSFMGYLDGYTDANAIFIAESCDEALAQELAWGMGIAYAVGVVLMQWTVMLYFALQDPSQACLLKLLHMDLLASCITLPADQKITWDSLALVRTVGEDVPQAILQTIYLVRVKRNPFMLLSVIMAVMSSLKALHDAWARALAADGVEKNFENRNRDLMLYSCSQDSTIRCWDVQTGNCIKVISCPSPANCVAATGGMLYSSHDDGLIREWSEEAGQVRHEFEHPGENGVVISTALKAYTWALDESGSPIHKEWSLETKQCLQEFPGAVTFKAAMFVKGDAFFTTSADDLAAISQWSLATGKLIRTFSGQNGHRGEINALFATSRRLLSGSQDGTAKEWSLDTGTCTRTFNDHSSEFLAPLCVIRDLLYNGSNAEPEINEWSLISGQVLRRFSGHGAAVLSIVRLKDKLYSSAGDRTIKEWSLDSGECLKTFEGHEDYISGIIVQFRED
eukprot:TRINITY_DN8058_c1_g2_i1.p1 TRINITY_DN8058_c1_g2~~TRINITY_DN8058_c1_g2_i1.p1  ORF type:complete len:734 (-),score=147.07 TRINITY_DN8058_c1_g2_i1:63-2264(-)